MLFFTDTAVRSLLTVQTQIDFTSLAPDHRSQPTPVPVPLARIAVRYVAGRDADPVVVPHAVLAVELQLAAGALQAAAFVALEGGFLGAAAGVTLLAHQHSVHPLLRALAAHYRCLRGYGCKTRLDGLSNRDAKQVKLKQLQPRLNMILA